MPARTAVTFQLRVRVWPAGTGPTVQVLVSAEFALYGALVHEPYRALRVREPIVLAPLPEAVHRHGKVRDLARVLVLDLELEGGLVRKALAAGEGGGDDIDLVRALGLVFVLPVLPAGAQRNGQCCQRPCKHTGA